MNVVLSLGAVVAASKEVGESAEGIPDELGKEANVLFYKRKDYNDFARIEKSNSHHAITASIVYYFATCYEVVRE